MLEINTAPGMTDLSLVPEQAKYIGIGYERLCSYLVEKCFLPQDLTASSGNFKRGVFMALRKVVVIAGPTASGKSQLAVDVARSCRGVVVNADSMQVYPDTPVLSAIPSAAERGG